MGQKTTMLFSQAWYTFDSDGAKTQKKDSLYIEVSTVDHSKTNFTASTNAACYD